MLFTFSDRPFEPYSFRRDSSETGTCLHSCISSNILATIRPCFSKEIFQPQSLIDHLRLLTFPEFIDLVPWIDWSVLKFCIHSSLADFLAYYKHILLFSSYTRFWTFLSACFDEIMDYRSRNDYEWTIMQGRRRQWTTQSSVVFIPQMSSKR